MVMATSVRSGGSSPLARGLPAARLRRLFCVGIIPARAGFTPGAGSVGAGWWDHPRSRGVYMNPFPRRTISAGSSPLARGLRTVRDVIRGGSGIIPARAGFTRISFSVATDLADHPRSRGVYKPGGRGAPRAGGSSPLARGLHTLHPPRGPHRRIIPARAGFTVRGFVVFQYMKDHPRLRGVYHALRATWQSSTGSSPLARGLPAPSEPSPRRGGIIPARAGFTRLRTPRPPSSQDHPRSRGVYLGDHVPDRHPEGSSPLARGLLDPLTRAPERSRIIPARAGFTWPGILRLCASRDHPRSRGVYAADETARTGANGSSPLARGLPVHGGRFRTARGIIPARAGFTDVYLNRDGVLTDHPRSRGVYPRSITWSATARGSSPLARGLPPRRGRWSRR